LPRPTEVSDGDTRSFGFLIDPITGRSHVSIMSEERVTLEFLGRQIGRVIAEQNATRDDLRVLTTIVLCLEGTMNGVLDQLHPMVAQHQRFEARLRRLEEEQTP
jgi:hypothetical protein